MTILSMIQDAASELNLPRPAIALTSTDPQVRQLVRLAKNEGRILAKRHNWSALISEHSFTTAAAAAQTTASLPTDLGKIIPESMFNRTTTRRVCGPINSSEWQETQASLVTQANPTFRIRGGQIYLTPTPPAGESVYYEYVSTKWCQSSGGTAQIAWEADADTGKLDEYIMTLGLVWRFLAAKDLSFSTQLANYEREVAEAILNDGVKPRLNMGAVARGRNPTPPNVPDTYVFT